MAGTSAEGVNFKDILDVTKPIQHSNTSILTNTKQFTIADVNVPHYGTAAYVWIFFYYPLISGLSYFKAIGKYRIS